MNTHSTLTLASAAFGLALAGTALAQAPAQSAPAVVRATHSADEELARAIADLNSLRETVASDKLPMAQQLTGLEDSVITLRKDADKSQRTLDESAIENAALDSQVKARDEELAYVRGLLDEYVRAFEGTVGVGEMQVLGDSIETAKQAATNNSLGDAERFSRQTLFADLTLGRMLDMMGGHRFAGVCVDVMGSVLNGQFAVIGPFSLFSADNGTAGIALSQVGSPNPLVRPLEGELAASIAPLVATGQGMFPLDPSRGGTLKALVQKTSLVHIFIKGGVIMWPLLAASVIAAAVVLERILFLLLEQKRRSPRTVAKFFIEVGKGDLAAAIAISHKSKDIVVTTLGYALDHRDQSIGHAFTYAETRAMRRYRRFLAVLDTVITLAPLLGLLGTVTGMMGSFSVIGGDLSSPGAITGGIAEALIATAFGLVIAICCLLPYNYLNSRIEIIENELLAAGEQLKLLATATTGAR